MFKKEPEVGAWTVFPPSDDLDVFATGAWTGTIFVADFSTAADSFAPQLSQKLFEGEFFVPHFEHCFVSAIDQLLLRKGSGNPTPALKEYDTDRVRNHISFKTTRG
jgi:hypothetical protein